MAAYLPRSVVAIKPPSPLHDSAFAILIKHEKAVPHEFVLDAMAPLSPQTRSMFGCLAVYVQDKIVLILRDKREGAADNCGWPLPRSTIRDQDLPAVWIRYHAGSGQAGGF